MWDDLLTPVPETIRLEDARSVARTLKASFGGVALGDT
jgi:hypothetical protein